MDDTLKLFAYGKTNLNLRVTGKRDDGFHGIDTRITRIELADEMIFRRVENQNDSNFSCTDDQLPADDRNLVVKAWKLLERHMNRGLPAVIELNKRIPHGAGLGGGSSDAATTLIGLNRLFDLGVSHHQLCDLAQELGSDVVFFMYDCVCRCTGRGELIEKEVEYNWRLPMFFLKPTFSISAAEGYKLWANRQEFSSVSTVKQLTLWGDMVNELEAGVFRKYPHLGIVKNWLRNQPEVFAPLMSGSGSTMFAVLAENAKGEDLERRAREEFGQGLWTWQGWSLPKLQI